MNKLLAVATTMFCLGAFSFPAWAFCGAGDPQGCAQPFANTNGSSSLDGNTTRQGFDPQTGEQWSSTSHKMGDFTFYAGMSSGNPWTSRDHFMGNGFNTPNFNSQGQTNGAHCAFLGTC